MVAAQTLTGIPIKVSPELAGAKRAVLLGDTLHISPAMWKLAKAADQDELKHLLANIEVLDARPFSFDVTINPLPMTTNGQ